MGTLGILVILVTIFTLYLFRHIGNRISKKKWTFVPSGFGLLFMAFVTMNVYWLADLCIGVYVDRYVAHSWSEQIVTETPIEDLVFGNETQGFLGFVGEREVLRFSSVNGLGERRRGMLDVSECVFNPAVGTAKIAEVMPVRTYANSADGFFFRGLHDRKNAFYRVYIF